MPEYMITHKDIYLCRSYVTADNKEEAREKFENEDDVDGPEPIEWFDRYSDYGTTIEEV